MLKSSSELRFRSHGKPHAQIMTWLGTYEAATPGVELGDNATVRLDADNEAQPDALLRIDVGGRSQIRDDDYEGAMELRMGIQKPGFFRKILGCNPQIR